MLIHKVDTAETSYYVFERRARNRVSWLVVCNVRHLPKARGEAVIGRYDSEELAISVCDEWASAARVPER